MTTKSYQDFTSKAFPTNDDLDAMDRDLSFQAANASRARTLGPAQVEQFNERGYLKPFRILEQDEADDLRSYFDDLLEDVLAQGGDSYSIVSAHMRHGRVYDLMFHARTVALMRDLLGDHIVCWGAHFFCKLGVDDRQICWHQDASSWPITPSRTVTSWLAIDDVDADNGCMRFVEGSHGRGHLQHRPSADEDRKVNFRSVDGAEAYGEPVNVELRAGEISLHSDLLLHGSAPNESGRRRCGLALRYACTEVQSTWGWN